MGHKFDPQKIDLLLGEERRKEMDPKDFLLANGLHTGMTIIDIGCGPGFFTLPAAEIVGPEGKVYALDVQEEMLEELRKRNPPENVVILKSGETTIPLEDHMAHMILMAFVLHEVDDKISFLKEVKRVLVPDGKFLLLEWHKKIEDKGPPYEERIDQTVAEDLIKRAGFIIEEETNIGNSFYSIKAKIRPDKG